MNSEDWYVLVIAAVACGLALLAFFLVWHFVLPDCHPFWPSRMWVCR